MDSGKNMPGTRNSLSFMIRRHLALLMLLACQASLADPPDIRIISSTDTSLYQRFQSAFRTAWSQPAMPGNTALLQTVYLDDSQLTVSDLQPQADLLVTIGAKAARAVAGINTDTPVLHTIIPGSIHRSIANMQTDCRRQSAIYIDQPIRRQLELGRLMFPQLRNYGVLLGPVSALRRAELEPPGISGGIKLNVSEVGTHDSTMSAGRELIRKSELFIAINDPLVLNRENAKWLLYVAYQNRIPVIGFSNAYVKAGAAAAVFSEPEQIARQAAVLARKWLASGDRCMPPAAFPEQFQVTVNRAVSRSLDSRNNDEQELHRMLMEKERP